MHFDRIPSSAVSANMQGSALFMNLHTLSLQILWKSVKWHGEGLRLWELNLSVTCTEMVHLLSHNCLLSGSEVHDL